MPRLAERLQMISALAWRILTYDKGRTALALIGIWMAILLVFVQLGLFFAVPQGGMLLYDHMQFDLLLVSDQYEFQAQPGAFPLSRLAAVRGSPDVAVAVPLYFGIAKWKSGEGQAWPDLFVIGIDPASAVLTPPSVRDREDALAKPDAILIDSATRPIFGPIKTGRVVELDDQKMMIAGDYTLGTGFMGLGVGLLSKANFARLFPRRGLGMVSLGAIRLRAGVDPVRAAGELHKLTGPDTRLFTRRQLATHEASYWTTRTSVGLIFGSGLLIAVVVGIMVAYQIVSAQVARQLPQFATMKAIGYSNGVLAGAVATMSFLIVIAGFFPAMAVAAVIDRAIREKTLLPVELSAGHAALVFAASLVMAGAASLIAASGLRRADPADIF